ncbi:MAG: RHS repeat-associated core domain-containing protein [Methanosarcinaceae archaeon]
MFYGGLGDRHQQIVGGVTTNYTLDLNPSTRLRAGSGLTQVLSDGTSTYLYGNGRVSQFSIINSQLPEYFLGDALGSVRQLADTAGAITLTQSYAPYGDITSSTGTSQTSYAFTGESRDANGLTYLRARYYNSGDGRFISRDTWNGDYNRPLSLNRWGYVEGNPVNAIDPTGRNPWWCAYANNPTECVKKWYDDKDRIWDDYLKKCAELEPSTSVFFVCGFGVSDCEFHQYSGKKVFGDVVSWANNNDYETEFYQSAQNQKGSVANDISVKLINLRNDDENMTVFLLGHSAGADSAVYGVFKYLNAGHPAENIGGIALLDSYLNIDGLNIIVESDTVDSYIPFWGGYSRDGSMSETDRLDFGTRLNAEFGEYTSPYTITHNDLAVDSQAQADIIAYFESRR